MNTEKLKRTIATIATVCIGLTATAPTKSLANSDTAKALSNPLASLISVPFQFNYDTGYGSEDGSQTTLNVQPVIPFSLNDKWNLITRTIIPYKWQNNVSGLSGSDSGFGDTTMSLWFSPKDTKVTWGVGPALYIPTSNDPAQGVGEWGGGITAVVLAQPGPWTVGALANHIWTFESDAINSTYFQPFVAYNTPDAWTYTLNAESSYDWNAEQWSVPINAMVSKLVTIQKQKVSLQGGLRYHAASSASGPDGWGLRFNATLVFPKK